MTKKKRIRKDRKNIEQKIYDLVQEEVKEAMTDLFTYGMCTLGKGDTMKFFRVNALTGAQEELFLDGDEAKDFIQKLNNIKNAK